MSTVLNYFDLKDISTKDIISSVIKDAKQLNNSAEDLQLCNLIQTVANARDWQDSILLSKLQCSLCEALKAKNSLDSNWLSDLLVKLNELNEKNSPS